MRIRNARRSQTLLAICARCLAIGAMMLLLSVGVAAAATCPRASEIESPLGCVETVVTKSVAPTGPSMADGGTLEFRNDIAGQHIRELYVPPGDYSVANTGDRVRVCLLSTPKKAGGCDPTKDIRGREFLVYDRTSNRESDNAAVYTNGEHSCGGA